MYIVYVVCLVAYNSNAYKNWRGLWAGGTGGGVIDAFPLSDIALYRIGTISLCFPIAS